MWLSNSHRRYKSNIQRTMTTELTVTRNLVIDNYPRMR